MIKSRVYLVLLLCTFIGAAMQVFARQPDLPDDGPSADAAAAEAAHRDAIRLRATQAAQLAFRSAHHRLDESVAQIQERFDLPREAIQQSRAYAPAHHNTYELYLQHPDARFVRLALIPEEWYSLYARPTRGASNRLFLVLVRVYHEGGSVVPVGILTIRPGPAQGHRVNFHDFVETIAGQMGESWSALQAEYGTLRIFRIY